MRWPAWLVVALLAVFLASGCGGDDGGDSSATQWADDVCSAITSWSDSITSTAASLGDGNANKDAVKSAVDDLESATSDFVDDVRGLGAPDTEAGAKAKESLDQLADDVDETLSEMRNAVDDASGVSGVVEAVTAVSAAISALGVQFSSTFTELKQLDAGGELEAAFKEADSCDELERP